MAMLKFRRGLWSQIINEQTNPLADGTIYIATDEQAMYVDTATKRIRISDFIRVDTVEKITPPYSTSSLYYVEDDNALLKYVETTVNGVTTGAWKQVNGTDDLKTRIDTAEDLIAANTASIGGNTTAINNLSSYVGTIPNGENNQPIAASVIEYINKKTDGIATSGNLEALDSRVTSIEDRMDTAEDDIDTLEETVAGHTSKISALETASAKHALKTDLDAYAKSADVYTKTQVYTKDEVNAAIDADVLVETNRAKGQEQALDSAIKAVQATAVTQEAFAEFQESNTQAITGAAESATTAAKNYTDGKITAEVTRADGAYAPKSLVETVNGHGSKINTLTGSGDGSVTQAKNRADAAYALAEAAVTTGELSDAIKNFATKTDVADAKTAVLGEANYNGTVKGAYEAAAAAQSKADSAYTLASGKTTAAEVKTQIEAYGYATTGYVDQAEADAIAAAKTAGDNAYAPKSLVEIVNGHNSDLTTLKGAATVPGSVAEAKKAGDDAAAALTAYKSAHNSDYTNSQIDSAVADAKKAGTDAQTTATAAKNLAEANQAAINTLNGSGDGSVAQAIENAKIELEAKIENDINAANAMNYAGGVADKDALDKIENVPAGTTYVAESLFTTEEGQLITVNGKNVHPGDLLIATGVENGTVDGVKVITDPEWVVVNTGYDPSLEQTLSAGKNSSGKNVIQLSSALGSVNGQVVFEADLKSSASVTVDNNTVTIGMVWEDFE